MIFMANMNGVRVEMGDDKKTIFIPLPPELWRPCALQPCDCPTCKANGSTVAYWDTLAVAANHAHTWTVHRPDLHKRINPVRHVGRFHVGQQFKTFAAGVVERIHTITDVLRTYDEQGQLINVRYTAIRKLGDEISTEYDITEATIAKGLIA
jgi:hypothetical protein